MRLAKKVALVTGGGSGIGRGICLRFAEEGARVAVADINAEGGRETVRLIGQEPPSAAVEADVSRRADCERMVGETVRAFGRLDVFVANAGIGRGGPLVDMAEEDWDALMAVNLKGVFLSTQAAARRLVEQGQGGKIILMSSLASERAAPGLGAYAAAKAGVRMLARVWALELAPHRINVNAIGPGIIDTPLTAPWVQAMKAAGREGTIPWGRVGTPRDVAQCALFLASEESEYLTGGILYPDGGLMAGQGQDIGPPPPERS